MAKGDLDRINETADYLNTLGLLQAGERARARLNAAAWSPHLSFHAAGARGFGHYWNWEETLRRRALRAMMLKYLLLGVGHAFLARFDQWWRDQVPSTPPGAPARIVRMMVAIRIQDFAAHLPANQAER